MAPRIFALFALLVLPLNSVFAAVQGSAQASSVVAKSFLDGIFYFNIATEGGSALEEFFWFHSDMVRVRFRFEERFLLVESMEDAYSNPIDPSLVSLVARFPYEDQGENVKVFWGDETSPMVFNEDGITFHSEGKHDLYFYDLDPQMGYLTFVKNQLFTSRFSGTQKSMRIRYNFLKRKERGFTPKPFPADLAEDFGYFTSISAKLDDPDTGYLDDKIFATRIDLNKEWVFELHPTVPKEAVEPITMAVNDWNDVFERTTGKRPLKLVKGEQHSMPGDLRHHVIYFRTRSDENSALSALATRTAIQETGEVIDGNVTLPAYRFLKDYKKVVNQIVAKAEERIKEEAKKKKEGVKPVEGPAGSSHFVRVGNLEMPANDHGPEDVFDEPFTDEDVERLTEEIRQMNYNIRGTTAHEIGHVLGLRHNFIGSADLKNLPEGKRSTSIMDYHEKSPNFCGPGVYDEAAIAQLYDGKAVGSEGGKFLFKTDHHTDDPRVNRYDSGEPLGYFQDRIEQIMEPMRRGKKLPYSLRRIAGPFLQHWMPSIGAFVGGVNDDRSSKAYGYLLEILKTRFSPEVKYQAIEFLSIARYSAARHGLLNAAKLSRAQRTSMVQALAEAIMDRSMALERERIGMVKLLGSIGHRSAYRAMQKIQKALEARLDNDDLRDVDVDIEDNVLAAIETTLKNAHIN